MSFIKRYLRLFLINLFCLWSVGFLLPGVKFIGGFQTIALTALVLTLISSFIKPLIKLLLLPVNLLTLGAFRWLVNVITLWLVTLVVPQFIIQSFNFVGYTYNGFAIPTMFVVTFWAFVLASLIISIITTFILWLIK